ncbi:glutamate receptor ionotropic, kainate glr-3 [Anabrus simplex]|uniref:glutamate receptor ionotropic, kainate glr-3 n=1 Tax=Anabrus simplex TaxID=316456 RepID=UPI0035A2DF8F
MDLALCLVLLTILVVSSASMNRSTFSLACSELVLDYSMWRHWQEVIIFVPPTTGSLAMAVAGALHSEGLPTGLQSMTQPQIPTAFVVNRHRLGIVLLPGAEDAVIDELLDQVSQKKLFNTYMSWLIVTKAPEQQETVTWEDRFRYLNIGLDSDLVLAELKSESYKTHRRENKYEQMGEALTRIGSKLNNRESERNSTRTVQHDSSGRRNSTNINQKNTTSKNGQRNPWNSTQILHVEVKQNNNTSSSSTSKTTVKNSRSRNKPHKMWLRHDLGVQFQLTQVYKLRSTANNSIVLVPLGEWDAINGSARWKRPLYVEERNDLQGISLNVGIKNVTMKGGEVKVGVPTKDHMITSVDDDIDDDSNLMDVLEYITKTINASYELIPFSKLGWKNEEKAWMYLLGAVVDGSVDLGLDNVIITQERSQDMFFTFPIVESMKNIYFHRPDTGAMRDIFLAPFSPRLLLCVAATGMVLAIAVAVINASTTGQDINSNNRMTGNKATKRKFRWGLGEAAVWSVSVLCMQGSSWNPNTASGSLVLIFSLCFALIIYNAYAAFITSVLSVRVASIKGLDDLLKSDFDFGYTLAGQDEFFLRTVNDTALRSLYFRGLVRNHGVEDANAGLTQVTDGGYAFFVSSRLARRGLNSFIAHDKRCGIQELTVESTRSVIALPMNSLSPYRKLINISLMRMREAGVLDRLRELMLPSMPRCQAYSTFNSARLSDVYSAFMVLGGGLVVGASLGITEALWRHRNQVTKLLTRRCCTDCSLQERDCSEELEPPKHRRLRRRTRVIEWRN